MSNCELILGDCLEKMNEIENNSIDLCLTDPPYGLEFMGKEWDKWSDSFTEKWCEAVFPKLKDGAFLVFTMSPRQDLLWRCLAGVEKAGFELGVTPLFWLYHTGFPKAMDASKTIDKQKGLERKGIIIENGARSYLHTEFINDGRSKKAIEKSMNSKIYETGNPISVEAKEWSGWKSFQPKPAVECIVVAQKPRTEKTIVGQVLKNGCGAVNIEECRIPYKNNAEKEKCGFHGRNVDSEIYGKYGCCPATPNENTGRFPANLLVSGEPLVGRESKSVGGTSSMAEADNKKSCYHKGLGNASYFNYGDSGSPNRFYSLDAWAEKNNITLTQDSAFLDVPKPSKAEKNKGLDGLEKKFTKTMNDGIGAREHNEKEPSAYNHNNHPTTKPIKLFSYLAKLFCQPKGTILDPFMGSGTTGCASAKMGFGFVGIEKEEEYMKIAEARIKEYNKQTRLD